MVLPPLGPLGVKGLSQLLLKCHYLMEMAMQAILGTPNLLEIVLFARGGHLRPPVLLNGPKLKLPQNITRDQDQCLEVWADQFFFNVQLDSSQRCLNVCYEYVGQWKEDGGKLANHLIDPFSYKQTTKLTLMNLSLSPSVLYYLLRRLYLDPQGCGAPFWQGRVVYVSAIHEWNPGLFASVTNKLNTKTTTITPSSYKLIKR